MYNNEMGFSQNSWCKCHCINVARLGSIALHHDNDDWLLGSIKKLNFSDE